MGAISRRQDKKAKPIATKKAPAVSAIVARRPVRL